MNWILIASALAGDVSVSPDLSETKPEQHIVLKTSEPGMVHFEVDSQGVGTSCEFIDHMRGPFSSAGVVGSKDCNTDVLLDKGLYKVKLRSPEKANKRLKIKAFMQREVNRPLRRLVPGRSDRVAIPRGSQASWWIKIDKRRFVTLRLSGRSVGAMTIWRNGEWREDLGLRRSTSRLSGKPVHEWRLERVLEPGDYLVRAHGASPIEWTEGAPDDRAWITYDAKRLPGDRQLSFTIPDSGWMRLKTEKDEGIFATLALETQPARRVSVRISDVEKARNDYEVGVKHGGAQSCSVEPKANIPTCATSSSGSWKKFIEIEGPPGTTGELLFSPTGGSWINDGEVNTSRDLDFKVPRDGDYLLGSFDLPPDGDAAPLSCTAYQIDKRRRVSAELADDLLKIDWGKPLVREFNYQPSQSIRFHVETVGYYRLETAGGLKDRCELYEIKGSERKRLTTSTKKPGCKLKKFLTSGDYELRIFGGKRGVMKLSIGQFGLTGSKSTAGKASCLMDKVALRRGRRVRVAHSRNPQSRRGLIARPLPLTLDAPLPLAVEGDRGVQVPVSGGSDVMVRALWGPAFTCSLDGQTVRASNGRCRLRGSSGTLSIKTSGTQPAFVVVSRNKPQKREPPLVAYSPRFERVPEIKSGQARFADFERDQSLSLLVNVDKPGLYDVTTTGLLTTECAVRTHTTPRLFTNRSGGRGRNCLVQTYLRPGPYLLTVKTSGRSRGRAGIVLLRRDEVKLSPQVLESERFYEAAAGTLYRTDVVVPGDDDARRTVQINNRGQGVSFQCRLEDDDGWPMMRVPTSCNQSLSLRPGRYRWLELPITVESQRQIRVYTPKAEELLRGVEHNIALQKGYRAELDESGKGVFHFTVPADMPVGVHLDGAMIGRLFRAGETRPLEVIARGVGAPSIEREEPEEEEFDDEEFDDDEYDGEEYDDEEVGTRRVTPMASSMSVLDPTSVGGQRVDLKAGRYRLETQHRQADTGVVYNVRLEVATLAPGIERFVQVPSEVPLVVPKTGFVRILTEGDADVRCRIFNARGDLVVENSKNNNDWNCGFTEPLQAGSYALVVESETAQRASTAVAVSAPKGRDIGALKNNTKLSLKGEVLTAALSPTRDNELLAIELRSDTPIRCAIADKAGAVLAQREASTRCEHIVRGQDLNVRIWTTSDTADVRVRTKRLPVRKRSGRAWATSVERPGRYATGAGTRCLIGKGPGVLRDCAKETSLPRDDVVFARYLSAKVRPVPLTERTWKLDKAPVREALSLRPSERLLKGARSGRRALHLFEVALPRGSRASLSCRATDGASVFRGDRCFAATGPVTRSLFEADLDAARTERLKVRASAALIEDKTGDLRVGAQDLAWKGALGVYGVPRAKGAFSLELSLAEGAWGVWVDGAGRAREVCAPRAQMQSCRIAANGGALYIAGGATSRARVRLSRANERAPAVTAETLETIREWVAPTAGTKRFQITATKFARVVEVDGATQCRLIGADGKQRASCRARLPAGVNAELLVEHPRGAGSAFVYRPGWREVSKWTTAVPRRAPAVLAAGERANLEGTFVDRAVRLEQPGVISVSAPSGVCAISQDARILAAHGLGDGCAIARVLPAGNYRVMVRGFAGRALSGALTWFASDVERMGEGVHGESWAAPGESRFFQFVVERGSEVGLGVRAANDTLQCTLRDAQGRALGDGCQQFKKLRSGTYLFEVSAPPGATPMRFSPVVLGLEGGEREVPEEVLREFFARTGEAN